MTKYKKNGIIKDKNTVKRNPTLYDILISHGYSHRDAMMYIEGNSKAVGDGVGDNYSMIDRFNGGITQGRGNYD